MGSVTTATRNLIIRIWLIGGKIFPANNFSSVQINVIRVNTGINYRNNNIVLGISGGTIHISIQTKIGPSFLGSKPISGFVQKGNNYSIFFNLFYKRNFRKSDNLAFG